MTKASRMRIPLTVIEIVSRSAQGMTRPFLCRGENDVLYYVKGSYAGIRALCCEWVAGSLGRLLGLPIPNFCIADVPRALIEDSSRPDAADLGAGFVFASELVEDGQEITFADLAGIDEDLQRKVLLFDWWVRNEDRTLTEFGGNPNLLRTAGAGQLRVFDLNLAFDDTFQERRFWRSHVFAGLAAVWPDQFKQEMGGKMRAALARLPGIWNEMPDEWRSPEGAAGLDFAEVERRLRRFETSPDEFWAIRK